MSIARLARIVRQRLRSLTRKRALDRELDRELEFHIDALTAEYIAGGTPPDEARRAARRAFGNAAVVADRTRDQRGVNWAHDLLQDAGHAWRGLIRQPGFTAVAVISLALGVGANAAVLSVIRSVKNDAVPFPKPDDVVAVRTTLANDAMQTAGVSLAEFVDWQARNDVFDVMGASINWQMDFGADDAGAPAERIIGQAVTASVFTTLGVAPVRGRWFTDAESQLQQPIPVVVLSYRLWQRRYGGDPEILSRRIRLSGVPTTVVGVMPASFRFLDRRVDFWVPLRINKQTPDAQSNFGIVARLKRGVTIEQARANLAALGTQESPRGAGRPRRGGVRVDPMRNVMYDWATAPLLTIEVSVAFVLLIACANVASLLLARGSSRQREMALRAALGAGRGRLVRQLLTESALLAGLGGAGGVLVAWLGLRTLLASMSAPVGLPRLAPVSLDVWTLAITGGTALLTLAVFGVAPAVSCTRRRLSPALKDAPSDGDGAGARRQRSRAVLVSAQVAWALTLLAGAGLLINSFVRLLDRDMHFEERGLLTFDYRVPGQYTRPIGTLRGFSYLEFTASPADALTVVLERLKHVPGAQSVAGISHTLVNSLVVPTAGVFVDGRTPPATEPDSPPPSAMYFLVTPGFFSTIRATLVAGRDFDARDSASAPWVAVVNETAARRLWPGADALGKELTLDVVPEERARQVVGVVRDMPIRRKQLDPQAVIYVSYLQQPPRYRGPNAGMFAQMSFLVRTDGDPASLAPAVQQAVAEIDPDRPLANLGAITDPGLPMLEQRNYVSCVGGFAIVATLLAAIGVYGVIAYSVSQRTREIGIRRALGAGTPEIVRLVSRTALGSTLAGLAIGLAGSLALSRFIASQLWDVTPTDPATFVTVSLLLASCAAVACVVPARRALRVDPVVALRVE